MIKDKKHSKNAFHKSFWYQILQLFKTSYIILVAIICTTFLLVLDNDPPSFPLPDNEYVIDCFNIINSSITIEKSRVKVNITTRDFIQYPNEIAVSLLSIRVVNANITSIFQEKHFWDVKSDLHHASFCVLQTFGGDVNAYLYCQNNLLASSSGYTGSIDVYPVGWSRSQYSDYFVADFSDICVHNQKLIFSVQPTTNISNIQLSENNVLVITTDQRSNSKVSQSLNLETKKDRTFLTGSNPKNGTDFLFQVLFPLARGILKVNPKNYYFQIASISSSYLRDSLSFLKIPVPLSYNLCYHSLSILPSIGSFSILNQTEESKKSLKNNQQIFSHEKNLSDHAFRILSFNKDVYDKVRSMYTNINPNISVSQQIVLDDTISNEFQNEIENAFPDFKVVNFKPTDNLQEILEKITSSKIYVASNFFNLLFGVFLSNSSTIIEVLPDDLHCSSLQKQLSKKFAAKIMTIPPISPDKASCKCPYKNLTCYFSYNHTYHQVKSSTIIQLIKDHHK